MNISRNSIPNHVAIIMDGNGRWAKERNLSRTDGHKEGAKTLEKIVKHSLKIGIKCLTVYVFSTENWKRSTFEVNKIFSLFEEYLNNNKQMFLESGIRIVVSKSNEKLKQSLINTINEVENLLKDNDRLVLNLAFNYGGRLEIVEAIKKMNEKNIEITEENISKNLYNPFIKDPDIVIRTGNDYRISNFLLWQIAYSELFFIEKYWPDFDESDLDDIIGKFLNRERRFGGIANVK